MKHVGGGSLEEGHLPNKYRYNAMQPRDLLAPNPGPSGN